MKLILKRIAKRKGYTIGKLYLSPSGESERGLAYLCDTLEPPCIEMKTDRPVEEVLAKIIVAALTAALTAVTRYQRQLRFVLRAVGYRDLILPFRNRTRFYCL